MKPENDFVTSSNDTPPNVKGGKCGSEVFIPTTPPNVKGGE